MPDADLAAQHFAGMLLWIPSNQIMFTAGAVALDEVRLAELIDVGGTAFRRAYAPDPRELYDLG